jgi:P27 family predicted phage terminase small subunit
MTRRPTPPRHLDQRAKAKWKELVGDLPDMEQGTLDALTAYAAAWSRMVDAEHKVQELGTVVKSPTGFPTANPYLAILQAERRAVRQWGETLRLTPKAKGRRKTTEEPADPILRIMNQRKAE